MSRICARCASRFKYEPGDPLEDTIIPTCTNCVDGKEYKISKLHEEIGRLCMKKLMIEKHEQTIIESDNEFINFYFRNKKLIDELEQILKEVHGG